MPELARKINAIKWRQVNLEEIYDVSADAITSSLKTQENSLSLWEIDSGEQIDQAALAMAAAGQHLETFDLVRLSPTALQEAGLELVKSDGITEVDDLKKTHFDLIKLSYTKLGTIASHIVNGFRGDKVKRYTKDDLRGLLNKAIQDGRLKKEDLPTSVSKEL